MEADMRSTNLVLKLVVLVGIIMLTFWGYVLYRPGDFLGACIYGALTLLAGLVSFDKLVAVRGNGTDMPGVLIWLSFGSIILSPLIFQVIPHELTAHGFPTRVQEYVPRDVIGSCVFGVFMAICFWAPLGCYTLIDHLRNRKVRSKSA
ncbi:hypothetical protein BH11PAT2_BH11PAT2_10060 [soil metagenome]